jgi:hypothetical protein
MPKHKKVKLSNNITEFFYVELRNEEDGGIWLSTLASALDSLEQAPDDVVAKWCGEAGSIQYGTQGDVRSDAIAEVKRLIKEHGKSATLESLLTNQKAEKEKKYPLTDWQYEVANGDTRLGYDEWVEHRVEAE